MWSNRVSLRISILETTHQKRESSGKHYTTNTPKYRETSFFVPSFYMEKEGFGCPGLVHVIFTCLCTQCLVNVPQELSTVLKQKLLYSISYLASLDSFEFPLSKEPIDSEY